MVSRREYSQNVDTPAGRTGSPKTQRVRVIKRRKGYSDEKMAEQSFPESR